MLSVVEETPGATIQFVANRLLCTHTTAAYHLEGLVRMGRVLRERDGRVVRHYCGPKEGPLDPIRFSRFMTEPRMSKIVSFLLRQARAVTPNEVAVAVGVYFGATMRDLKRLGQHELVIWERRGGRYGVRCSEKLHALAREARARDPPGGRPG